MTPSETLSRLGYNGALKALRPMDFVPRGSLHYIPINSLHIQLAILQRSCLANIKIVIGHTRPATARATSWLLRRGTADHSQSLPPCVSLSALHMSSHLYIPMPLLWTVKLPLRTKILCSVWLCSGVFIIVATLLRCVLSLQNVSRVNLSTIWAIRETVRRAPPLPLPTS